MINNFQNLLNDLSQMGKHGICLAFSGGIDSSLLLYLCKDLNITAVTFKSVFQTDEEIQETIDFCRNYDIKHKIIEFYPLENEILCNNPQDRCYHCKKLFFSKLKDFAKENNPVSQLTAGSLPPSGCSNNSKYIIDGTNYDDTQTYRPGLKAIKELDIISPYIKHKITKKQIREYAKELGLKIFNKPSTPCIATRFPYNTKLTEENILKVKKGENILKKFGFISCRLRYHDNTARIEIEKTEFQNFMNKHEDIISELKKIGFNYITLDLEGLRSGSMDIGIQ